MRTKNPNVNVKITINTEKVVEHTHEINGVSATKSERKSVCISARCHTNTRKAKASVAKEETTRFTRGLSSRISLLLKSFFSFVYGGTCTRLYLWWHLHTFVCMGIWMYGCMVLLALFLCFWGFFTHYVSVSLAFAILPHECLLGCLTQRDTHTSQCGATCNVSQHLTSNA